MAKSIKILDGRATLYPPTEKDPYWRVRYIHPTTGKPKMTSGGKTQDDAESRAAVLVGDWTPNGRGATPPPLREVFNDWMESKRSDWSTRTYDQYKQQAKHFLRKFGDTPISQISPNDFGSVDVSHLSREQQTKVRSLIRGTMRHGLRWIHGEPDAYAKGVRLSGSKSDARQYTVSRGDVAPATYINDVINACYATAQIHPVAAYENERDGEETFFNEKTGEVGVAWLGNSWIPTRMGMDADWVQQTHRRGMPKHYKNIDKRMRDETKELAARYRMFALAAALIAGSGLRIGELLALRVRDFVEDNHDLMEHLFENARAIKPEKQLQAWDGYRGKLLINKQASQTGSGRIVLSLPKYDQIRTTWVPATLHHPSTKFLTMTRREQVLAAGLNHKKYSNPATSLWEMNWYEALTIWSSDGKYGGIIPVAWLLLNRLNDLWDALHANRTDKYEYRFDDFQKLLLFPTRSQPRKNSTIEIPRNWKEDTTLVKGFGGYASTTNFANVMTNPIFDYVSEKTRIYPEHRKGLPENKRRGWTMHALRHYFVTSNIYHGTPLPALSEMAGHRSINFTLSRYAHALETNYENMGFE